MNRLIIIDISNFIFRAFFAIRPLHAPDGTPVNAVFGVLSMLYNLILKHQPTHILIARDTKEGSFRKKIYPEYKAHRTEPPADLIPQFELVDELIKVLRIPEIRIIGYEADDIIGSVVTQWKDSFEEILIVSGDKDLMQFVDGPVKMLDTMKDKTYSRDDVKEKMGVYPEQIVDYLSLIGDASDNIPGVEGIGPKGAQNLIEEFGTLDEILQHLNSIKNKRAQTSLIANKDMAILSRELVKIICDLQLKLSRDETVFKLSFNSDIEGFLEKLGFRSWTEKLKLHGVSGPESEKTPSPKKNLKKIKVLNLDDLQENFKKAKLWGVLPIIEDDLNQHKCWRGVVIANEEDQGYLPLSTQDLTHLFEIIHRIDPLIICYQSKPILQLAMSCGINPHFNYFDLAQAHFILNPEFRHDLETMTEEFLQMKLPPIPSHQRDLLGDQSELELNLYAQRCQAILDLYPILKSKMKEYDLERPYSELDIPLMRVLAGMELEGVCLDTNYFKELEKEFSDQIDEIESTIYDLAKDKINLRSPKQVAELLFEKLGLPIIRKTKTGYSTDAEVLAELDRLHLSPVPGLLLKYREVEKLLSTYVRALPALVDPKTKKIHTHFQPSNAATGRLSSDNPNLQNIPVRTENGRKLRKGFIPSPGRLLLSSDYSQVELRLLAHFSQDQVMLESFKMDKDIHRQTASEIFDIPIDQVTKDMRNSAKAINFGLMYGQTSFGLSQALHISQGEAKKYITNYFQKFQSVKIFLDGLKEKAEEKGYAETMFGRKRFLPDIRSTNRQIKAMAERMAINSPIQGTAADIIKLAMINIQRIIDEKKLKSRMILQVHDELIFDVAPEELEEMKTLVKNQMEGTVSLSVKLKVEMGVGNNWYDLK